MPDTLAAQMVLEMKKTSPTLPDTFMHRQSRSTFCLHISRLGTIIRKSPMVLSQEGDARKN